MSLLDDRTAVLDDRVSSAWRTVLVHVDSEDTTASALNAAVDLAKRSGAHLIGVGAEHVALSMMAVAGAGAYYALKDGLAERLSAAEEAFRAGAAGLSSEWRAMDAPRVKAVASAARAADVIVTSAPDAAAFALASGRPVLTPPRRGAALKTRCILVAWKDTREAQRAVQDAMPLLLTAKDVLVVEVCVDGAVGDAQFRTYDVAQSLRRHGVPARAKVVEASRDEVGETVRTQARIAGAGLIVAGCYGHTRLQEQTLGGVSRTLLSDPGQFLLMSH